MQTSKQYKLTWEHFKELHDDYRTSFENLCWSLFRKRWCDKNTIPHANFNNPGVETEPIYSKIVDAKIAFQSKFFDNNINYNNIKSSVKQTIDHYSENIDKFYLFCNLDLNRTCKSYKEIEQKLNENHIELVVVSNQTILDYVMDFPELATYYFGMVYLDQDWFAAQVNLSLNSLGQRYNRLFNIDNTTQQSLSIFLGNDNGIQNINNKKIEIKNQILQYKHELHNNEKSLINKICYEINLINDITTTNFKDCLKWGNHLKDKCSREFKQIAKLIKSSYDKLKGLTYSDSEYFKTRHRINILEYISDVPENLLGKHEKSLILSQFLLVNGEMGTGKSQLFANAAKNLIDCDRTALLLLGHTFFNFDDIHKQIIGKLGLSSNFSIENLFEILNEIGYQNNTHSILFIDAINESYEKRIWKDGLIKLATLINNYPYVKIAISIRSGFDKYLIDEFINQQISNGNIVKITHHGFADTSPTAVYDFLAHYGIPFSPEYYLQNEMSNPLFLTWFCKIYGEEQIANTNIYSLIEQVIKKADSEASTDAGSCEPLCALQDLLYQLADFNLENSTYSIAKTDLLNLPVWNTYGITQKIQYLKSIERFGILSSFYNDEQETYYFGYNLLEDYIIAKRIINKYKNKLAIKEYCTKILLDINETNQINNMQNESIFIMLTALFAENFNEECIDIIDDISDNDKFILIDNFFKSFVWRDKSIKLDIFIELVNKYHPSPKTVCTVLIENSTKVSNPLNAEGLHSILFPYPLNKRDYLWTTEINNISTDSRIYNLIDSMQQKSATEITNEQSIMLLLILFSWILSSSNRYLRDKTSKAMIELLKTHFNLCIILLKKFKDVNDPYINQRLYGIIFGACTKRVNDEQNNFEVLADWIYENIFNQDIVYPDILLRDYARLIIERFLYEYPEMYSKFNLTKIKPPYNSDKIPKIENIDYSDRKFEERGVCQLLWSMRFNINYKNGGIIYGDFGRYVFQSALENFEGIDLLNTFNYAIQYIFNKLGYSSDLFGEYDTSYRVKPQNHHQTKKTERIGKKYEWIAMYHILARISDHHKLKSFYSNTNPSFTGPWEPYIRDFDPTLNINYNISDKIPKFEYLEQQSSDFIDCNTESDDIKKWTNNNSRLFQSLPKILTNTDSEGAEWVNLYYFQEWKHKPQHEENTIASFSKGEQHIWVRANSYFIQSPPDIDIKTNIDKISLTQDIFDNIITCYSLYNREYVWSPGYQNQIEEYIDECKKNTNLGIVLPTVINFLWEEQFDASQDNVISFMIPCGDIIKTMNLQQKEFDGLYYHNDKLAAFDSKLLTGGSSNLWIRKNILDSYLEQTGLYLFWALQGEKQFFTGGEGYEQIWNSKQKYYLYPLLKAKIEKTV